MGTNPSNKGLISVDRSNKATLLLTIPSFIQVVCKGFPALGYLQLQSLYDSGTRVLLVFHVGYPKGKASLSSMDSDLEAFSHNPTDGSFAPLTCQSRAKTNYPNQRFLSY